MTAADCPLDTLDQMYRKMPAEFAVFMVVRHVPEHDGCQVWKIDAEDPAAVTASPVHVFDDIESATGLLEALRRDDEDNA